MSRKQRKKMWRYCIVLVVIIVLCSVCRDISDHYTRSQRINEAIQWQKNHPVEYQKMRDDAERAYQETISRIDE